MIKSVLFFVKWHLLRRHARQYSTALLHSVTLHDVTAAANSHNAVLQKYSVRTYDHTIKAYLSSICSSPVVHDRSPVLQVTCGNLTACPCMCRGLMSVNIPAQGRCAS
jgi:hypothetical protein